MIDVLLEIAEDLLWVAYKLWVFLLALIVIIVIVVVITVNQDDGRNACEAKGGHPVINESHKVVCTTGVIK